MNELIYIIDRMQSEEDNVLVIKIQEGERDGFVLKQNKHQKLMTRELLYRLSTPKDSALLPLLIKEECAYAKKTSGKIIDERTALYDSVHISHANTSLILKQFAMTGKLYFNDKQLVIDLYSKTHFYYSADATTSTPSIEGRIKSGELSFELKSCDFIGRGPPHWFIKGINLKYIFTDLTWIDLKSAFNGQIRPLAELIEEANCDPEVPKVELKGTISFSQPDPMPVLVLKDRLGAFADLWMDYGNNMPLVACHDSFATIQGPCKRIVSSELGWENDLLETDYIKKSVGTSHYYCPLDKVSKSIAFLLEIGWLVRDWQNNRVLPLNPATLSAETGDDCILIKGKIHYDQFQADLTSIVGAFIRRDRFAVIAPGYVALLPNQLVQAGFEMLAEQGEIIGDSICLQKKNIGALASLFETHKKISLDSGLSQLKERLENFQAITPALPGDAFCGTLRPYQQTGLNWLSFLYDFGLHGMLADDMGLGKTVQVIAFLSRLDFTSPILIVLPTSLIFNWKRELECFLPKAMVQIHHGANRSTSLADLNHPHIILTSYTTLRLDFSLLSQLSYACLILDEAQAIKNAHTQTFQAVSKLNSQFRLSITGTPVENNLQELWSHFRFLIPDLFGEESAFIAEVQAGMSDPRFLKRIKKTIRPFLLRRQKEEVAKDLPEKMEQTVWVEMSDPQRSVYDNFLSGVRNRLINKVGSNGKTVHRMEILEAIMRLRQICCHPLLVTADEGGNAAESAKLEALMQDLETVIAEKRKVLVYSQFTSMLAIIGKRLKVNGWPYVYLDGSTHDREKVVTQFQEDPAIPIFLISLKAGGIGLNLTAADYVFLYDPWWNEAVEKQAIDRAHRIGRKETVFAKRYIMAESIEEKMMKLKKAKSSLAADLLDDDGNQAGLTADDLLFLLS